MVSLDRRSLPWIFSAKVDLWTFLGSAVLALGLLWLGKPWGLLEQDSPEWLWISAVLMVDVAHVYATGFRVYFDRVELRRRPWLYALTPLIAFAIGWALYSESPMMFWRILAYLAVFHFVRQQYGWVALYRAREGDRGGWGWWVDALAIYAATLYPLLYWHVHLPRQFWWFLPGDFASLPAEALPWAAMFYWLVLGAYAARSLVRGVLQGAWNPGKDIVLVTTALCWYLGIVTFNSDYAFTVTNVITHGLPYMVLVYWYRCHRAEAAEETGAPQTAGVHLLSFLAVVWMLAFLEEMVWDCGVWHERSWLFGRPWHVGPWQAMLVALLAVPQVTHYVLDGFIWRRRSNRRFAEAMASGTGNAG